MGAKEFIKRTTLWQLMILTILAFQLLKT
jgi:hypothetical protein